MQQTGVVYIHSMQGIGPGMEYQRMLLIRTDVHHIKLWKGSFLPLCLYKPPSWTQFPPLSKMEWQQLETQAWVKWNHIWPFAIREEECLWSQMVGLRLEGCLSVLAGCSAFSSINEKGNHCSTCPRFFALENIDAVGGCYCSLVTLPVPLQSKANPWWEQLFILLRHAVQLGLALPEWNSRGKTTDGLVTSDIKQSQEEGPFPAHMLCIKPWTPLKDT